MNKMTKSLKQEATEIAMEAIQTCLPDPAVQNALLKMPVFHGRLILVSIGKAAWRMASAAAKVPGIIIDKGIVITKYGHVQGQIPHVECYEAGHPVLDENSIIATKRAEELVENLSADDLVLFLVSGGGSALFEDPLITLQELQNLTSQLLACGAGIEEINTIRKRLSKVKAGRFALQCMPARVYAVILSDIIGDPLDMIASGPAYQDSSTAEDAEKIVSKYHLSISEKVENLLKVETPKRLTNVETVVTGSVSILVQNAANIAKAKGYETEIISDHLNGIARETGRSLAIYALKNEEKGRKKAWIAGGETVVEIKGNGKGGRNQEIALAAAEVLSGHNMAIVSVGSDGTDGPTDAAGGVCDGKTAQNLNAKGIRIPDVLQNNDAYHALEKVNGLIKSGPTGTNVNDVTIILSSGED